MASKLEEEIAQISREIEGVEEKIAQISREIEGVEEEIAQISRKIEGVEEEITLLPHLFKKEEQLHEEKRELREKKRQLRKKEEQLRKKEEQLREEKRELREKKRQRHKEEEQLRKKEEQLREEKLLLELLLRSTTGSELAFTTEVSQLLTSLPPFPLDGDRAPTAVELSEFLMDFSCLEGKVPTLTHSLVSSKPFYFSTSGLAALTTVLVDEPLQLKGEGEMVATYRLIKYVELLMRLMAPDQLPVYLGMDKAVPESSTQSARCRKRKRPDAFVQSVESVLLYVEGKKEVSALDVAVKELSDLMNKVPDWVFGKLQFTLAAAVAGSAVQVLMKRPSSKAEPVMKRFNLHLQADRVTLLLVFIKMYSVMLSMSRVGDAEEPRTLTLFVKHQRDNSCVELDGEGCLKTIEKWSEFSSDFGVKLKDVRAAYTAAAAVDQLVKAEVSPKVTGDKYMVRTRPLGYSAEYKLKSEASKEEACKKLVRDVLHALVGLHGANLVHRDVRLANVIWWPEKLCYVLIDLETVATAGVNMKGESWTDYTPGTLKRSKYKKTSDLHQLGVLLQRLSPAGAESFVKLLKGHHSSAKELLEDAWLK